MPDASKPPDSNHLNQTTSPTYHTLKHEEPVNLYRQHDRKPALGNAETVHFYRKLLQVEARSV